MNASPETATPPESVQGEPPDLSLRARPPTPRRLSRKVLLVGALGAGGLMATAFIIGLSDGPSRGSGDAPPAAVAAASGPPDTIRMAPQSYDPRAFGLGRTPEPFEGEAPPEDAPMLLDAPPPLYASPRAPAGALSAPTHEPPAAPAPPPPPDPQDIAQAAPILFADSRRAAVAPTAGQGAATGPRAGFVAAQRETEERLTTRLTPPRSRYELLAGSVIPAALVTELNSDLPGRVIAQVTTPVYDSVTGKHLLIPQGARLLGTYDSGTAYGDNRLMVAWNRIVFPNGWSISLQGMEGTDPTGAAGLRDRTDNHLGRLIGAIALSSVISVGANEARDRNERGSMGENIADAAAQQAAQTGARIVDRDLNVRPTLRVRAGAPVRVLVSKDIQLRPYPRDG